MKKLHITTKDPWTNKRGFAIDWNYKWYFEIGFGKKMKVGKDIG